MSQRSSNQRSKVGVENPRAKKDITHVPPAQLTANILKKEQRIAEKIMANIGKLLAKP